MSTIIKATLIFAASPSAHRVARCDTSWLDPVHTGHALVRKQPRHLLDHARQGSRLERRLDEREVECQLQLVAVSVERHQILDAVDARLADEQAAAGRTALRSGATA